MASGLGAGFGRLRRSFFSDRPRKFYHVQPGFWLGLAKGMERRHRSSFSILANELRRMGPADPRADCFLRVARLERWMSLG